MISLSKLNKHPVMNCSTLQVNHRVHRQQDNTHVIVLRRNGNLSIYPNPDRTYPRLISICGAEQNDGHQWQSWQEAGITITTLTAYVSVFMESKSANHILSGFKKQNKKQNVSVTFQVTSLYHNYHTFIINSSMKKNVSDTQE